MSNVLDAINAQYAKNAASGNNKNQVSQEERMKKYFVTLLPKGVRNAEKRIRILPTKDGSSPFVEVYFHEIQVDGKWVKLYDPAQEGKRSPLNEVRESLMATGLEEDKELAKTYRSRKFYIVKLIDRDNEQDGVKFWRFKHNTKSEGVLDKIFPIFKNKGDITDPKDGRDLILSLSLTKSGNGKEYTSISSIIPDDKESLNKDESIAQEWINDELTWSDVYSKKGEDYLEIIATGGIPRWDNDNKKYVPASDPVFVNQDEKSAIGIDPQENDEPSDDLPF